MGLYTAPHDPCPEGRLVLDFETAVGKGYDAILQEIGERISALRARVDPGCPEAPLLAGGPAGPGGFAPVRAELRARRPSGWPQSEADPARKGELLEMAAICRRVPAHPPSNFREAVQSFWFTYLLGHLEGAHLGYSPGRLDQLLFPYYTEGAGYDERRSSSSRNSSSR